MNHRGLIIGMIILLLGHGCAKTASAMPVDEFVRQTFIHGVPYEEARQYGKEAVPKLLGMLADPKEEANWSNVVVTLCMIGDDRAVDPLIEFVAKGGERTLSPAQYNAKTSALMAMGYVINKTGNKKALDYLKSYITPTTRKEGKLHWKSPYHPVEEQRDAQLSTMAILGLALSGRQEAKAALNELKKPSVGAQGAFKAQVSSIVDEALETNDEIAKGGLSAYYQKAKP